MIGGMKVVIGCLSKTFVFYYEFGPRSVWGSRGTLCAGAPFWGHQRQIPSLSGASSNGTPTMGKPFVAATTPTGAYLNVGMPFGCLVSLLVSLAC